MHIFQQVVFIQIGFTDDIVILVYHAQYSCFEIPVFQNLKNPCSLLFKASIVYLNL